MRSRVIKETKIVASLPKIREEVKNLDAKLTTVLRELPDKKEIEGFLRSISVLAVDTGLEVLSFKPQPEKKEKYFARLPVKIQLEGTFHKLVTFLDEVGHLPRIVNIEDLFVKKGSETDAEVVIKATCQATTFRYLDSKERSVVAAELEAENVRRRRR